MPQITFSKDSPFYTQLKVAVNAYFEQQQLKKTGNWRLYSKAVVLLLSALLLYGLLLWVRLPAALALALCALFGFVLASIGFNVMHDSVHGSYSSKKWVNAVLALTLNALGGNAFIYKYKHLIHHNYTNVDGLDDDIAKSPLMRQCLSQKWVPAHRFQHVYIFLVYAVSGLAWITLLDFTKYFTQRIYVTPLHKMQWNDHLIFWVSKLLYVFFYIALPLYVVGTSAWLAGFLVMNTVMGLTLALVFQLAHVIENTHFVAAGTAPKMLECEWAVHQVKTTANFAMNNKFINWYVGGLNYQIEHHLFPKISHIHYPALGKIVQQVCRQYNLPYHAYPTMAAALASHIRLMKALGKKPDALHTQPVLGV